MSKTVKKWSKILEPFVGKTTCKGGKKILVWLGEEIEKMSFFNILSQKIIFFHFPLLLGRIFASCGIKTRRAGSNASGGVKTNLFHFFWHFFNTNASGEVKRVGRGQNASGGVKTDLFHFANKTQVSVASWMCFVNKREALEAEL